MAPSINLPDYVISKKRGRYFYFRRVEIIDGKRKEHLWPLPHPLDDGFRQAYNEAWLAAFGVWPEDDAPPTSVQAMVNRHKAESPKYKKLSKSSRDSRDRACRVLTEKWGLFDAREIRPEHCQALYDSFSDRLATANRLMDDVSAIFAWGVPRGFATVNPASGVEREVLEEGYEPWPLPKLEHLLKDGNPHIARVAAMAFYTGADRGDLLKDLTDSRIDGTVWTLRRAKTKRKVRIPIRVELHSAAMEIIEDARAMKRQRGIVDPDRPLLVNSRGEPWGSGFGASWNKELKRLDLKGHEPRLTFKGLRATNATLIANAAAKGDAAAHEIYEMVRAMLGHQSDRMAAHYARTAEVEASNRGSVELLPIIGKKET